jgi:hypothetical protein
LDRAGRTVGSRPTMDATDLECCGFCLDVPQPTSMMELINLNLARGKPPLAHI